MSELPPGFHRWQPNDDSGVSFATVYFATPTGETMYRSFGRADAMRDEDAWIKHLHGKHDEMVAEGYVIITDMFALADLL